MQDTLSLYELNALVRRSLEQCLPDEYWVQAELSDVRTNSTGHCYLEFVQKDPRSNNLIAKARGTIWANIYRLLKPYFEESTGQLFTSGIKVLVKVTVAFHELYGYSLTVQDIDPTYTLGDMARRRREILRQLEEEGVLTLNKELEMPLLPQRIAVISSATAGSRLWRFLPSVAAQPARVLLPYGTFSRPDAGQPGGGVCTGCPRCSECPGGRVRCGGYHPWWRCHFRLVRL